MKKRALAWLLAFSMIFGNTSYLYAAETEEVPAESTKENGPETEEADEEETAPDGMPSVQGEASEDETVQHQRGEEGPAVMDAVLEEGPGETVIPGEKEGQDQDALFAGYVDRAFGPRFPAARKAARSAGSRLTGVNAAVYAKIAGIIPAIAAGEESSTVFTVSPDEIGLEQTSWTAEELGVESLWVLDENGNIAVDENNHGTISESAKTAAYSKARCDLSLIVKTLLADFPYELYWYDKTASTSSSQFRAGIDYDYENQEYFLYLAGEMKFRFPVAGDFAAGTYTVNTSVGQSVQTSVHNAQDIVSSYSSASDDAKLLGYKNEICSLASYNFDAAEGSVSFGNPWQMIWVFDGDPTTSVVCEGYSKAFKYLCDQSDFSGDVSCIMVTGDLIWGTDSGLHMWNIVGRDDGFNYLVDVTNCDEGMIGSPDYLFLTADRSGDLAEGYTFDCEGEQVTYAYDADTKQLYTENELVIGERTPEEEVSAQVIAASVSFKGSIGLNYYIDIPEEYLSDSGAYIAYRIDKLTPETGRVKISDLSSAEVEGRECRKMPVYTVVKSINDKITIHVHDGEGNKLKLLSAGGEDITEDGFVYSVGEYCDDIAEKSSNELMKDLAYKLKQYGFYVQKYLGYKADEAEPALDFSMISSDTLEPFRGSRTGSVEGLDFIGSSFLFKEDSALRYRFKLSEGYSIDAFTFSVDGKNVTPALMGSQYVIEVGNIRARDLGKEFLVEVTDQNGSKQTLNYSGLSYARALIEQGSTEEGRNAAKALYLYYDAAIRYFGS